MSATRWLFDGLRFRLFEFGITTEILEKYEEVIGRYYSPTLASNVVEMLPNLENAIWVTPYYKWNLIAADSDDNKFVDCAISCQDQIITHDKHFKVLQQIPFPKVKVIQMEALKNLIYP